MLLQIRVVQGDGAVYAAGSRTPGFTVEVTDELGKAVPGAVVSFQLPNQGPGGLFAGGLPSEIVTTGADGRAGTSPIRWNRLTGTVSVRVTAGHGDLRAGTMLSVELTDSATAAPERAPTAAAAAPKKRRKWLLVAIAAGAGAAGIGLTAGRSGGSAPQASAATQTQPVQIGTPTIIIGKP